MIYFECYQTKTIKYSTIDLIKLFGIDYKYIRKYKLFYYCYDDYFCNNWNAYSVHPCIMHEFTIVHDFLTIIINHSLKTITIVEL